VGVRAAGCNAGRWFGDYRVSPHPRGNAPSPPEVLMNLSTLSGLLVGHAKVAAAVAAVTAATAGGGLAVAGAVANSHADAGLARASAAASSVSPQSTPTGTPTVTPSATSTDTPTSGSSSLTLPPCPSGVANHGAYVSMVAHMTPSPGSAPNARGKLVSQAAQSSCGKPAGADAAGAPDSTQPSQSEAPDTERPDSGTTPTLPPAAQGHGKH
jgi:hypothetical protein